MTFGGQKSSAFRTPLPPVAFGINIPVTAMPVTGGDPYRIGARRFFPPARLPVIFVSFIAVVSAYPDVVPAWTRRAVFVDANRWPNPYNDLSIGRYYPKGQAKQSGKNQCSHFLLLRLKEQVYGRSRVLDDTEPAGVRACDKLKLFEEFVIHFRIRCSQGWEKHERMRSLGVGCTFRCEMVVALYPC